MTKITPLLLLASAILAGCMGGGSYRNYTDYNGKIENGVLYDPCGRFTIKVPYLAEPGAVIRGRFEKQGGSVEFSDDFGKLIRVDIVTAVDPQSEALVRSPDWKRTFAGNRIIIGELYKSVCPKTEVLHQEYITTERAMDFYVFNMPECSTLSESGKRQDAWRASITIVEGNSLFTLTTQHIPGLWKNDMPQQEVFMEMQKTLLDTLQTVTFEPAHQSAGAGTR